MTIVRDNMAASEEAHCVDTRLYRYTYHGCRKGDVLFTNAVTGSWNVTRFEKLMVKHPELFTAIDAVLDEAVAAYVAVMIETDSEYIASLTPERLKDPLYGLWMPDHDHGPDALTVMLIDGHHRVMRLWKDGVRTVTIIMLRHDLNDMVRVKRTKERLFP